jgi:hypothetical protein
MNSSFILNPGSVSDLFYCTCRNNYKGSKQRERSLIVSFVINCTINLARESNSWVLFNFALRLSRLEGWQWDVRNSNFAERVTDCKDNDRFQTIPPKKVICLLSLRLLLHAPRVHLYTRCVNAIVPVRQRTHSSASLQLMAGNIIITVKYLICRDVKNRILFVVRSVNY